MLSCDSPDSGDYHSPHMSPALGGKRDSTPPPSTQTLAHLYGDLTWAPIRITKRRRIGKIVPIPFRLEKEEEHEATVTSSDKTTPSSGKSLGEHSLATGDSHINQSLELLSVSTSYHDEDPSGDSRLSSAAKSADLHLKMGEVTPPTNMHFIYRQYGDLTHAPSSDRVARRPLRPPKIVPRRLSFNDCCDTHETK